MDTGGEVLGGLFFALPGKAQTVPRAELYAIRVLAEGVEDGTVIQVVSDSDITVKGLNAGRAHGGKL